MRMSPTRQTSMALVVVNLLLGACAAKQTQPEMALEPLPLLGGPYNRIPRTTWNRLSLETGNSLFWLEDTNHNGAIDPEELGDIWGLNIDITWDENLRTVLRDDGTLSDSFALLYARLEEIYNKEAPTPKLDEAEAARRQAILSELDQSYFTAIANDFRGSSDEDRAIVKHILAASALIERIFAQQMGVENLERRVKDPASRFAFFLNQSPWCSGPLTENDPQCTAIPGGVPRISGLYPKTLQQEDPNFCDTLAKLPNGAALFDPFTVVMEDDKGGYHTLPYSEAYKKEMKAVAHHLIQAANTITTEDEGAFKRYLLAAAQAFLDNHWFVADEAWAAMNANNSKWYLRIGPDETYFEPCSRKAGFHVSFARVNEASRIWQQRLEPVKGKMETTLANMAGDPYQARNVAFHMPEFIDIVLNAGDSREARGATIGQSLPNWGPVADKGGRTVAMANFYTDPDSLVVAKKQAQSILCADAFVYYTEDREAQVVGTVLHEAAHNLGPSHDYKVRGRTGDDVFGGPLASMLEELKAQTSALFLVDWLVEQKILVKEFAEQSHLRDILWAFGHISRGMAEADGKPKPYSQLGAIQMGVFVADKALIWRERELAADGDSTGCFAVDMVKLKDSIARLEKRVLTIKAQGNHEDAQVLQDSFVTPQGEWQMLMNIIRERYLRYPRASFLYSIRR